MKLDNERREKLAQALARGESEKAACRTAGYKANWKKRIMERTRRSEITERVDEILQEVAAAVRDLGPVIEALMKAAEEAGQLKTAAGFTAARALLAEAAQLKAALPEPDFEEEEEEEEEENEPPLDREAWLARFGPKPA